MYIKSLDNTTIFEYDTSAHELIINSLLTGVKTYIPCWDVSLLMQVLNAPKVREDVVRGIKEAPLAIRQELGHEASITS